MAKKQCNNCGTNTSVSYETNIPYIVYEAETARQERHIKRMWIALIIAIAMLFASNIGWLIYESQYETIDYSYDYQQDGNGTNIIGDSNEVNNGAEIENQDQEENQEEE